VLARRPVPTRSGSCLLWLLPAACASLLIAREARADVSSWFFLGGGASSMSEQKKSYELKPTMQIDLGMGTPASHPVVVGGLVRASSYFGQGVDLGLALRLATQGYATGKWGVALDGGGYQRWWGMGSTGFITSLALGAPFGITLSLNATVGSDDHRVFGAVLGVDLLRLTVHRLGGESQWYNPRPAWRPGM